MNQIFAEAGLQPIKKRSDHSPLSIGNLSSVSAKAISGSPLLSVIMPVFNAASTIRIALRSVLSQTWQNLEVIVVDDCSEDETRDIVAAVAAVDPRVSLVKLDHNQGAYRARNHGLRASNGMYVTVHDGDDWSHPQKFETQVRYLEQNANVMAAHFQWIRVLEDLTFVGPWRAGGDMVTADLASLMYRREVFDTIGCWDNVSVGADTEFHWRVAATYGEQACRLLAPGIPISFALSHPSSLTRTGATHARTIFYGVRRQYREAAQWWHKRLESETARADTLPWNGDPPRPFAAPSSLLGEDTQPILFDIVFVMDFAMSGGAFVSTINYIKAAVDAGKRVGLMHWRRYDLDPKKPVNHEVQELTQKGAVEFVPFDKSFSTELVLVCYPVILQHEIDHPPPIDAKVVAIIVNQMANRLFSGGDPQYDPSEVSKHAKSIYGCNPLWIPISGLVKELMKTDTRYRSIHSDIWSPLIDLTEYGLRSSTNEIGSGVPVIGRHCRDHYTKWPNSPAKLASAFGVNTKFDVRILGGAECAIDILGTAPNNWTVLKFNEVPVVEFLSTLDFFIHYPHEDYIEEYGRSVLEAMAIGVPVILPHVFERTFGDAAVYAKAEDVPRVVHEIWSDPEAYRNQVKVGREFAERVGDYSKLVGRLDRLFQAPLRGKGKLAPHQAFLEDLVARDPHITLFKLRDALADTEGVRVHHSSIAKLLARLGFTYKKSRWWRPNTIASR